MAHCVRALFGVVVGMATAVGTFARMGEESGAVPPTLAVELQCERLDSSGATLAVTLRNSDFSDTTVVLGIALVNGRVYLPTALKLRVRRPGQAHDDELPYANPDHGFFSGRIDAWAVPLPAGSAFTASIPLRHFVAAHSYTTDHQRFDRAGQSLDVRVALDARPVELGSADMRLMRVWVGALLSNSVHIPSHCV